MNTVRLTAEERTFAETVHAAAFANPFSTSRKDLDAAISGLPPTAAPEAILEATLRAVRRFVERLDRSGRASIKQFPAADSDLTASVYLFDIFHRFMSQLDDLILRQMDAPEESCRVPFADDILQALSMRGFRHSESVRFLALFYQLRRAYYFVALALVGSAPCMRELRLTLWNNVFTHDVGLYVRHLWDRMEDFSTLLLGETGTGKGAAATAIGRSGFIPFDERRGRFKENFMQTFIAINLSQFSENLIESELFGHRKGAFTGAVEAHEGVFARCSACGSIFLDEIGDVSIPVQIKLLKVLQERTFTPVGSHEERRFRGRVIAATNKPLDEIRRGSQFRDDFYYRLCSDLVVVPSLRQRLTEEPDELRTLLQVILGRILGDTPGDLIQNVRSVIIRDVGPNYPWPGNVRELEQCVRRIMITRSYRAAQTALTTDLRARILDGVDAGTYDARDLQADYCRLLYQRHGTYEDVARRTGLDRRTVKKYVTRNTVQP